MVAGCLGRELELDVSLSSSIDCSSRRNQFFFNYLGDALFTLYPMSIAVVDLI
jgi:hypothetical protein